MSEQQTRPMSDLEIISDYRQASNKAKQISILANLNLCQPRDIAELLAANGQELPKAWREQLTKPRRNSSEDLAQRAASHKPGRAPTQPAKIEPEDTPPAAAPSPARQQVTVGKLTELLRGLPPNTEIRIAGDGPLLKILYTRDYDAEQGSILHLVLLRS